MFFWNSFQQIPCDWPHLDWPKRKRWVHPNVYERRIWGQSAFFFISWIFRIQIWWWQYWKSVIFFLSQIFRIGYSSTTFCVVSVSWGLWAWWRNFRMEESRNNLLDLTWHFSVWSCISWLTTWYFYFLFFKRRGMEKKKKKGRGMDYLWETPRPKILYWMKKEMNEINPKNWMNLRPKTGLLFCCLI